MYERLKEMQTAAVGLGVRGKGKKNKSAFTMHKTGNPNQHKDKVQNRHFKEPKKPKNMNNHLHLCHGFHRYKY